MPRHIPAGSFPLVIDYALAKGLAHEAFGHASEADGFRSSILAESGRFKVGESVGPDTISIIDEPRRPATMRGSRSVRERDSPRARGDRP